MTGVFLLVLYCSVFYGLWERTHFAHQHTPRFLVSCMCLLGAIPAPAYPLVMLTPTLFPQQTDLFPWPKQAALLGWVPSRWLTPACCRIPTWHGANSGIPSTSTRACSPWSLVAPTLCLWGMFQMLFTFRTFRRASFIFQSSRDKLPQALFRHL